MYHHNHHPHFHYFLNRELSEIYWAVAIRAFALALISIFVPIYLLKQGFSLQQVFLFYVISSFVWAVFSYFSAKLSTKIGLKHNMLISMPFLIAFLLLLRFTIPGSITFFLAAIMLGIQGPLFWISFHADFARFSSKKTRTKQIGGYRIICLILSAIGPVVGGLILLYSSFNILFVIVAILLLFTIIPLSMSKEVYTPKSFSIKPIMKKVNFKYLAGFAGFGMNSVAGLAWIIFIFIILKSYLSVGALTSTTLAFSIVFTILIGFWADKYGKGKTLRIGSVLTGIGWIIRIFVRTGMQILGINIFFGMTGPAGPGGPAYDAINYDSTQKKHATEIMTIRETTIHGFRALFFALLYFISSFPLAFAIGAVGAVGTYLLSLYKKAV